MINLKKIYDIFAETEAYWLPDFSNIIMPENRNDSFDADTLAGYEFYCEWLTEYLATTNISVTRYQLAILERLRRKNELSNPYLLAGAVFSAYDYFFEIELENYPGDFLNNPDPSRLSTDFIKEVEYYSCLPDISGISESDHLQIRLVFAYIAKKQIQIYENFEEPKWIDIGWRAILKEGLQTVESRKDRIEFTKNFIDEMDYMQYK